MTAIREAECRVIRVCQACVRLERRYARAARSYAKIIPGPPLNCAMDSTTTVTERQTMAIPAEAAHVIQEHPACVRMAQSIV